MQELENFFGIKDTTTTDDKVEMLATFLGSFILGASFAKEFFQTGVMEVRIYFFGVSCLILFIAVSLVARIKIKIFDWNKKFATLMWPGFFFLGNLAAVDLFEHQFLNHHIKLDIRSETIIFLASYTIATNLLYTLNKNLLLAKMRQKTIYKYLLAPINGLSLGVIITGVVIWAFN
jgi:hypothetical protein